MVLGTYRFDGSYLAAIDGALGRRPRTLLGTSARFPLPSIPSIHRIQYFRPELSLDLTPLPRIRLGWARSRSPHLNDLPYGLTSTSHRCVLDRSDTHGRYHGRVLPNGALGRHLRLSHDVQIYLDHSLRQPPSTLPRIP